jgi:hypothetical protein
MTVNFYEMIRLLRENPGRQGKQDDTYGVIEFRPNPPRLCRTNGINEVAMEMTYASLDAQYEIIEPTRKGTIEVEEVDSKRDFVYLDNQQIAVKVIKSGKIYEFPENIIDWKE